jgi:peptide/nickel transport system substrate-binding protein
MSICISRRSVLAATAAFGATTWLGADRSRAAAAGNLRVRLKHDVDTLDPAFINNRVEFDSLSSMFQRLINFKSGDVWEWELDAAESIEQVDPTHIKFTLKSGLGWTGGFGEMTAEDVKYSFERVTDPAVQAVQASDWGDALDHVEVTGQRSGVIVLKQPNASVWTTSLLYGAGSIVCKAATEKAGGKFGVEPPATSGPYAFKSWTPQQQLVLQRNELWTGARPDFDQVTLIPIENDKSAELAFLANELDFTIIAVSSVPTFRNAMPDGAKLLIKPTTGFQWLGMNVDHKPFDDIRVRQAIQKTVDVRQVIEGAFFGVAPLSTGLIAPGVLGHREAEVPSPDLAGAKALLAEAGLPNGFKTTITVINRPDRLAAAQIIQQNLAQVGIEAEITPYESGTFWTLGQESEGQAWKDLQLIMNGFTSNADPQQATTYFTPSGVGVWNWERWSNAEFGELDVKGMAEMDPVKRAAIYVRMMEIMAADAAYVFITHEPAAALYRATIEPNAQPDGSLLLFKVKAV